MHDAPNGLHPDTATSAGMALAAALALARSGCAATVTDREFVDDMRPAFRPAGIAGPDSILAMIDAARRAFG